MSIPTLRSPGAFRAPNVCRPEGSKQAHPGDHTPGTTPRRRVASPAGREPPPDHEGLLLSRRGPGQCLYSVVCVYCGSRLTCPLSSSATGVAFSPPTPFYSLVKENSEVIEDRSESRHRGDAGAQLRLS